MFWNAPIWLNEMLVSIIKFLVEVLPLACIISAVILIYGAIKILRGKRSLIQSIKDKSTLITLGSLFVSCAGLILFYMPQPVMHDSYSFDDISIRFCGASSESQRITISGKEELNEFRKIFNGRICSRSFDSGSTIIDSDIIFIDLNVFDNYKVFPLHFIVSQNNVRRYTAANTDFVYTVEDDDHVLAGKLFEYAEKSKSKLENVPGNSSKTGEPPGVSVTSGDKEINCITALNQWNGVIYDREDTFHTIMQEDSGTVVPYIQLGNTFNIEFKGTTPDAYELKDHILNDNGSVKYAKLSVQTVPIEFHNGTGSFILEKNMGAFASSDIKDYEKGATIRGFRLICSWGDNECEYAFVIRTDAH